MTLALIDGNAFYCSYERVFEPKIRQRPVIVLSNNDGCAVARRAWSTRFDMQSPRWTTRIDELPVVGGQRTFGQACFQV